MKAGYIYVLQNKSYGDCVIKIGRTTKEPYIRAKELYSGASGVPEPFDIAFACQVGDCVLAEKKIHERLKAYRKNKKREFFIISIEVAKKVILSVCQEVNKSLDYYLPNLVVIDSIEQNNLNLSLEDTDTNDLSDTIMLRLDQVSLGIPNTSSLSIEQIHRVKIIVEIFQKIIMRDIKDWLIDFSRDCNPEKEIQVWENIAKAFNKINHKYFDQDQTQEAFYLLFLRSMMSDSEVLEKFKIKMFFKKVAKEILRGYEAKPVRMIVGKLKFQD